MKIKHFTLLALIVFSLQLLLGRSINPPYIFYHIFDLVIIAFFAAYLIKKRAWDFLKIATSIALGSSILFFILRILFYYGIIRIEFFSFNFVLFTSLLPIAWVIFGIGLIINDINNLSIKISSSLVVIVNLIVIIRNISFYGLEVITDNYSLWNIIYFARSFFIVVLLSIMFYYQARSNK